MEKVIVPKGTKQDFSDIFDDLQNYIAVNFERRFNRLIDQSHGASYGIIMEQRNESFAGTETSFSTTITDTAGGDSSNLTFTSGQAIVRNATTNHIDYIRYASDHVFGFSSATAVGTYHVWLCHAATLDHSIPVINGYLFDGSGSTSNTNSRSHEDMVVFITTDTTMNPTGISNGGGVKVCSVAWNGTDTLSALVDERQNNLFFIEDSIISDRNIVKKDRDIVLGGKRWDVDSGLHPNPWHSNVGGVDFKVWGGTGDRYFEWVHDGQGQFNDASGTAGAGAGMFRIQGALQIGLDAGDNDNQLATVRIHNPFANASLIHMTRKDDNISSDTDGVLIGTDMNAKFGMFSFPSDQQYVLSVNNNVVRHNVATTGKHAFYAAATDVQSAVSQSDWNSWNYIDTNPTMSIWNPDKTSDADGSRASIINFKGFKLDDSISHLGYIKVAHEGTSDDHVGKLTVGLNRGTDADNAVQEAMYLHWNTQFGGYRLGLGISNPTANLQIAGNANGSASIRLGAEGWIIYHDNTYQYYDGSWAGAAVSELTIIGDNYSVWGTTANSGIHQHSSRIHTDYGSSMMVGAWYGPNVAANEQILKIATNLTAAGTYKAAVKFNNEVTGHIPESDGTDGTVVGLLANDSAKFSIHNRDASAGIDIKTNTHLLDIDGTYGKLMFRRTGAAATFADLSIISSPDDGATWISNTKVGIGIATPTAGLHVVSNDIKFEDTTANLKFYMSTGSANNDIQMFFGNDANADYGALIYNNAATVANQQMKFYVNDLDQSDPALTIGSGAGDPQWTGVNIAPTGVFHVKGTSGGADGDKTINIKDVSILNVDSVSAENFDIVNSTASSNITVSAPLGFNLAEGNVTSDAAFIHLQTPQVDLGDKVGDTAHTIKWNAATGLPMELVYAPANGRISIQKTGASSYSDFVIIPSADDGATTPKIGIGIENPSYGLHVKANNIMIDDENGHALLYLMSGTDKEARIWMGDQTDANTGGVLYDNHDTANNEQMKLRVNNVERLYIGDGAGNPGYIGMGIAAPTGVLHVKGTAGTTAGDKTINIKDVSVLNVDSVVGDNFDIINSTASQNITIDAPLGLNLAQGNVTSDAAFIHLQTPQVDLGDKVGDTGHTIKWNGTTSPTELTWKASNGKLMYKATSSADAAFSDFTIIPSSDDGVAVGNKTKVGIGIATPTAGLHVRSNDIKFEDTVGDLNFYLNSASGNNDANIYFGNDQTPDHGAIRYDNNTTPTNGRMIFHVGDSDQSDPSLTIGSGDGTPGNVGIGTTSPSTLLNLHEPSSSNAYFKMSNDTSGNTAGSKGFDFAYGGLNMAMINREAGFISFETTGVERLRILADGKTGIGTTTPDKDLHVAGSLPYFKLENSSETDADTGRGSGIEFGGHGASTTTYAPTGHIVAMKDGATADLDRSEMQIQIHDGSSLSTNLGLKYNPATGGSAVGGYGHKLGIGTGEPVAHLHIEGYEDSGDVSAYVKLGTNASGHENEGWIGYQSHQEVYYDNAGASQNQTVSSITTISDKFKVFGRYTDTGVDHLVHSMTAWADADNAGTDLGSGMAIGDKTTFQFGFKSEPMLRLSTSKVSADAMEAAVAFRNTKTGYMQDELNGLIGNALQGSDVGLTDNTTANLHITNRHVTASEAGKLIMTTAGDTAANGAIALMPHAGTGYVGINTDTPTAHLHIKGDTGGSGETVTIKVGDAGSISYTEYDDPNYNNSGAQDDKITSMTIRSDTFSLWAENAFNRLATFTNDATYNSRMLLGDGPMLDSESIVHVTTYATTGAAQAGGYAKSQIRFSNGTTNFFPDSTGGGTAYQGGTIGLPSNASKDMLIANRSADSKLELTAGIAGTTDSSTIEAKVGDDKRMEITNSTSFFLQSLTVVDGTDTSADDKYEIGVDSEGDLIISGTGATLGGLADAPGNVKKFAYEPLSPSVATKFVLYDVNPTSSTNEMKSKVMMTWNYRHIEGTHTGADGKLGYDTSVFDDATEIANGWLTHTSTTDNSLVNSKKKMFFSNTSNVYTITEWDISAHTFKLIDSDGNIWDPSAELAANGTSSVATTNDPARIIDRADGYTLTVKEDGQPGVVAIAHLEQDQVNDPFHYLNLDLGKSYTMTLVSKNGAKRSAPASLSASTYDPDYDDNNQGTITYTVPWTNTLPALTDVNANNTGIATESSAFGFNINIGADVWFQTSKPEQTAHEFEIGWTTESTFSWTASTTQKIITADRFKSISMNAPANVKVGVRPLQNRTAVSALNGGSGYITNVTAGGGGIPPGDQQILSTFFDVLVVSGQVTGQSGDSLTLINNNTEQGGVNITINNDGMNGQTIIIDDGSGSNNLADMPISNTNTLIS